MSYSITADLVLGRAIHRRLARPVFVLACLCLALLLAGCAGQRGGPIPYEVAGFGPPDAPSSTLLDEGYRIAPLDKLSITVFQVPDLSGEFEVDLTGNLSLPLVGNVRAIDLTPAELDAKLTQLLGEKYLQSPDVSVGMKASSTRVVTVDGAVRQPGIFPAHSPITLIQAIAMAQGTTENANPRRVAIFRQISGQRMAAAFDLVDIRRGKSEDPRIYVGDIVIVDGSQIKAAQREILQSIPLLAIFRPF